MNKLVCHMLAPCSVLEMKSIRMINVQHTKLENTWWVSMGEAQVNPSNKPNFFKYTCLATTRVHV